jgi:hypothetical protein
MALSLYFPSSEDLNKIWSVAHFEKKLNRNLIFSTNVVASARAIKDSEAPLKLSAPLMLGLAKIYNKKMEHLLRECLEAITKIKLVYNKGTVDLPDTTHSTANIDDARHFGQILPDAEFPGLADEAFSQGLVARHSMFIARSHTSASKGKSTIGRLQDTTEPDYYLGGSRGDLYLLAAGQSPLASRSSATGSGYSDIEVPRQQLSQSRLSRNSLERRSGRSIGSMAAWDEEVPAVRVEDIMGDDFQTTNLLDPVWGEDLAPPMPGMDSDIFQQEELPAPYFDEPVPLIEDLSLGPAVHNEAEPENDEHMTGDEAPVNSSRAGPGRQRGLTVLERKRQEEQVLEKIAQAQVKKKATGRVLKRQRVVVVDTKTELSHREFKQVPALPVIRIVLTLLLVARWQCRQNREKETDRSSPSTQCR